MSHVPDTTTTSPSSLLALPLELRLQIYNYVLESNTSTATFSSAKLIGKHADIIHRLYGDGRSPHLHDLPEHHIPVVEPRYEELLLSKVQPAKVHAGTKIRCEELGRCEYSPIPAIMLVNRQICAEIRRHLTTDQRERLRRFSLFMSYPHGVHIFSKMGSHLLPSAHTIQVAGQYSNISFSATRAARVDDSSSETEEPNLEQDQTVSKPPSAAHELSELIASALGPIPKIAQLQLRIYYPGSSSYSTVWGDDDSPTVVALRNIFAGDIEIEVWRGREGTGVNLTARPSFNNKRTVSTTWKRLNEGSRPGDDPVGTWIVDPSWPQVTIRTSDEPGGSMAHGMLVSMQNVESPDSGSWPPAISS